MDEREVFERLLEPGEQLLWAGQPASRRLFYPVDLIRLAFGLLFAGFPTYVIFRFFIFPDRGGGRGPFPGFGYLEVLFLIPFIIIGIWVIGLGGVIKRVRMAQYTRYAVTDRRVIIANTRRGFSQESIPISRIPGLTKRIWEDGAGTIILGIVDDTALNTIRYSIDQSSAEFPSVRFLYEIPDAESVYGLLNGLIEERESQERPSAIEPGATLQEALIIIASPTKTKSTMIIAANIGVPGSNPAILDTFGKALGYSTVTFSPTW